MNAADIAILAVLALSMLFGLLRGFVSEVLSLACWVAAFWAAWMFGDRIAAFYGAWVHEPTARLIAGYVTCFLGVLVIGALIGWAMRKLMDGGGLRGGDRFLGMLFGLARGMVLVTFVVLMLGFTALPREAAWWRQSVLLPPFENGAGWVAQALPPEVTHYLEIGGKTLPALSQVPISAVEAAARHLAHPGASGTMAPPAAATTGRAAGHGPGRDDVGQ
ncbi:MAG: Colicin V production protein [Rhodanobacteraceae bacterium]|jgi:membrane protein required for colicin V production|nr:MAG: Colicin V production protein [Rhodanobacteraceae bacterium]